MSHQSARIPPLKTSRTCLQIPSTLSSDISDDDNQTCGESPRRKGLLSSRFLSCKENSRTITRNAVVAVFHRGGSFPNFDGAGQSYFNLMGIEYVYWIKLNLRSGRRVTRLTDSMTSKVPLA